MSSDKPGKRNASWSRAGLDTRRRLRRSRLRISWIDRDFFSGRSRLRSDRRKIENNDVVIETFTLPLEAARLKVRDVIDDTSRRGYQEIVERWRQLPDGQIEFTMRRLPIAD